MVLFQNTKAFGESFFVQPFDVVLLSGAYGLKPFRKNKLDRPRTIFANFGKKREYIPGRNLEFPRPPIEDDFVIGEQPPEESLYRPRPVLRCSKRH